MPAALIMSPQIKHMDTNNNYVSLIKFIESIPDLIKQIWKQYNIISLNFCLHPLTHTDYLTCYWMLGQATPLSSRLYTSLLTTKFYVYISVINYFGIPALNYI